MTTLEKQGYGPGRRVSKPPFACGIAMSNTARCALCQVEANRCIQKLDTGIAQNGVIFGMAVTHSELLNLYLISGSRNRDIIERFLNTHVDTEASADRGREELMLMPLGSSELPSRLEDWNWEPTGTLSHIIERGLQHPQRAFSVSLRTRDTSLAGSMLV